MVRLLLATSLLILLASCACDPGRESKRLAGTRATHCGFVELGGDRSSVTDCLDAAIARGRSAYGGWALETPPSGRQYYVIRPARTYDIAYVGAEDQMTIAPCVGTPVRVDDAYTCDGELLDPYEFCD